MRALAVACCILALAGCSTLQGALNGPTTAKSLDAAYALADGATLTVEQAVKAGVLKGDDAAKAQTYLRTVHTTLTAASAAKAAGDAQTVAAQIAAAENLIIQVNALVGSK